MDENKMFEVQDPRGITVYMTQGAYIEHILFASGHNEVQGSDVMNCVATPLRIYQSSSQDNRHVYFAYSSGQYPKMLVKTVAETDDGENSTAHVVTAFLQKTESGGIITTEGGVLYDHDKL